VLDLVVLSLRARELLRERGSELIAETCAWSVGIADHPHYELKDGRVAPTGQTLGSRAELEQPLGTESAGRIDLADARPGSFQDALNAHAPDGTLYADQLDLQVLTRFAEETGVRALEDLQAHDPEQYAELLDELGEDGTDLPALVRSLEWLVTLRTEGEELVLAALGDLPLLAVEREGVPLSVVRAAERLTRDAAPPESAPADEPDEAVIFLAHAAIGRAGLSTPVPPEQARALLVALLEEGLEADEVRRALDHLPVLADTAEQVTDLLDAP